MRHLPSFLIPCLIATGPALAGGWGFPCKLKDFTLSENSLVLTISINDIISPVMTEFLTMKFDSSSCDNYRFTIFDPRYRTLSGFFFGYTILDDVGPFLEVLENLQENQTELDLSFIAEFGDLHQISACHYETVFSPYTFSVLSTENPSIMLGF